jgi:hypothetical protein
MRRCTPATLSTNSLMSAAASCGHALPLAYRRCVPGAGCRSEDVSMKLALIAIGLLATTGVVYAACLFC